MKTSFYVMEQDGSIRPALNEKEYLDFVGIHKRHNIAHDNVYGLYTVVTSFLGVDHKGTVSGKPLVFETTVDGGPLDGVTKRYATREDAIKGHVRFVALCKNNVN